MVNAAQRARLEAITPNVSNWSAKKDFGSYSLILRGWLREDTYNSLNPNLSTDGNVMANFIVCALDAVADDGIGRRDVAGLEEVGWLQVWGTTEVTTAHATVEMDDESLNGGAQGTSNGPEGLLN